MPFPEVDAATAADIEAAALAEQTAYFAAPDYAAEQAAGRRQARDARAVGREIAPAGLSWWEKKDRAALNAEAEARATEMSKSRVGQSVKGQVNTP